MLSEAACCVYYDIYVSHFRGRGINSRTPSKSIDFSWRKIEREREREVRTFEEVRSGYRYTLTRYIYICRVKLAWSFVILALSLRKPEYKIRKLVKISIVSFHVMRSMKRVLSVSRLKRSANNLPYRPYFEIETTILTSRSICGSLQHFYVIPLFRLEIALFEILKRGKLYLSND